MLLLSVANNKNFFTSSTGRIHLLTYSLISEITKDKQLLINMEKTFWNIYKTFFKVGTLLLGGGYVILPLLQSELVDKKKWATSDELCEYYALGQSVPGIIAANMSIFVGYKLLKQKGAIAAATGIVTPAFMAIVLIARVLSELVHFHTVKSIFWGVGIGVVILVFLAVKEMWNKSVVDKFSFAIAAAAFTLSAFFKVSPVILIITSAILGISYQSYKRNRGKIR